MTVYPFWRRALAPALLFVTLGTDGRESVETVRVRLFSGKVTESVVVEAVDGGRLTIHDSTGPLATIEPDQTVSFDIWNEFLRARWQTGSVPMDHAFLSTRDGAIAVTTDGETRSYRGSVELVLDGDVERPGLLIINEVALPDYIASVLPSEYGFPEPEGVKAQAIVIRTYALRAKSRRDGLFDLTDDTGSQVYGGRDSETALARAAVSATRGMTITYEGELIEAVYSAHCGGHSADNEDVWSSRPVPYLRGRNDPYDKDAPVARWESRIDRDDLHDLLSRTYKTNVKGIKVRDRGSGDRATSIRLDTSGDDIDIGAQSFRVAVNARFGPESIKSTFFDIEKGGGSYRFVGRGLGHGVGLCQWGAAAQAREGRSYQDILSFYYRDVDIEGFESDFQVASVPLADASEVSDDTAPDTRVETQSRPTADVEPSERERPRSTTTRSGKSAASPKLTGRRVGW
jgi:stage II sporulation protein D